MLFIQHDLINSKKQYEVLKTLAAREDIEISTKTLKNIITRWFTGISAKKAKKKFDFIPENQFLIG